MQTAAAAPSPTVAEKPPTIVMGGDDAVRMPEALITSTWSEPPTARIWRIFVALLWCADREGWWSIAAAALDDDTRPPPMRLETAAIRDAAGYGADRGLARVREAIDELATRRFIDTDGRQVPILAVNPHHGGCWLDVQFGADLVDLHRHITVYALVNLQHVRALRTPLDCCVYALACLYERRKHPVVRLTVIGLAAFGGLRRPHDWSTLGRPFRTALQHVADVTGARFACLAYSNGVLPGVDHVEVQVGHVATPHRARFRKGRRRHRREFVIASQVAAHGAPRAATSTPTAAPTTRPLVAPTKPLPAAASLPAGGTAGPAARAVAPAAVDDIPF